MNRKIRNEIMEILDNHSKDIPDGVYLELCNKLQKFDFDNEKINPEDYQSIEQLDSVINPLVRARNVFVLEERRRRMDEYDRKYILNPETGRDVLRTGRVGRRLVAQELANARN